MQKNLNDHLILRSLSEGFQTDKDNLPQFYMNVFKEEDEDYELIGEWVKELISGHHQTVTADDTWVVVDSSKQDMIVSALFLIPQTWRYEDIELPVGRVEIVATHVDYRRRGLIRELIAVAHERSQSLGHIMQGITGIEHYYRRFGYAMAIDLGSGAQLPITSIPKLKADETTRFTLRPATNDDLPNIEKWDAYDRRDGGLSVIRDWHYEINQRFPNTPIKLQVYIIESIDGEDVGFVAVHMDQFYRAIGVSRYIIGTRSSYYDTFDDVLRGIKAHADKFYATLPDDKYPIKLRFDNAVSPSVYALISTTDNGLIRDLVYSWYIRVDDMPAFIKHITPVLESRLAGSSMNRFSGTFKVSFHKLHGICMTFKDGKITDVTTTELTQYEGDTALPYDTFLNIVFGHRTRKELTYILPEVYANRKADLLFEALFPKVRSRIGGAIG
jgi:GNAT superfamily N-acetyltransferase